MGSCARRALYCLGAMAVGSALCAADVTFSQSDWTTLVGDTQVALGPSANNAWTVEPTGGDTGSWVQFSENLSSATPLDVSTGLLTNAWVYNPATQGQIFSINYSADVFGVSGISPVAVQPFLFQSGNYYFSISGTTAAAGSWQFSSATGQTAADFFEINPTSGVSEAANPNFSAGGAPITFGYVMALSVVTGASEGYDNINIRVVNSVPEPASFMPLGAGIGLIVLRRRRAAANP